MLPITETQRLAEMHGKTIQKMIEAYTAEGEQGIQAFGAELRRALEGMGLVSKMPIHHSQVCPHEDNRDGELLIPIAVWRLAQKILRKEWSDIECALALSCGIPPPPAAEGEQWKTKAVNLARQADGLLPPYQPELLTAATAAGSHTTAVLRLLSYAEHHRVKCPAPEFEDMCADGYLSYARCVARCPSIKTPLVTGMVYFHIRHEIVVMVPQLMRVLSQADNAKHTLYCKESPIQTMLGIHRRALAAGAKSKEDWDRIAKACAQGFWEEFLPDVRAQCSFVEVLAGGPSACYLHELDMFWKTIRQQRDIDARLLADLASSGTWLCKAPEVAIALVKATLVAPPNFLVNNLAVVFNTTDLEQAKGKNSEAVSVAHGMIMAFRKVGAAAGVGAEAPWHRILGQFEARMVIHIFEKRSPSRKAYKTLTEICLEAYKELEDEFGTGRLAAAPCPWAVVPIAKCSAAGPVSRGMKSIAIGGVITRSAVEDMGYKKGMLITKVEKTKNQRSDFVIHSLTESGAMVVPLDQQESNPMVMQFAKIIEYYVKPLTISVID